MSSEIRRLFPGTRWEVRETSTGTEFVLEDCPLDLQNRGADHPKWKAYVNLEKGALKCFVCHSPGQGMKLSTVRRRLRNTRPSANQVQKDMRRGVKELPQIPDGAKRLTEIDMLPEKGGIVHPCYNYLALQRGISYDTAVQADIFWKPEGVPAWVKTDNGKEIQVGTYSGIILPIYTRGELTGWQLSAVPRKKYVPKYVTAPGSKLSGALYNFDVVVGSPTVVVTEGVFDALRIPDIAVALLTDNISKRKLRLLSTGGFTEIVLCLDSDRSERHVKKELAKLHGTAPIVRAVLLPTGDPSDYPEDTLREIIKGEGDMSWYLN